MPAEMTNDGRIDETQLESVDKVAAEIPATTEVTIDETDNESVDMSAFQNVIDGNPSEPVEKKEEVAKEEKVEEIEEVKEEEEQPKKEEAKKPTTQPTTSLKKAVTRDYTGIAADKVPLFQRMSNEAFDALKPYYIEAEKTKAELATIKAAPEKVVEAKESFYEHPEAYTLSEDYKVASSDASTAAQVFEFWKTQLDAVRSGATEFTTLANDPKTGRVVIGGQQKVAEGTQSWLESVFMSSQQQAMQFQNKINEVKGSFTAKHSAAVNDLKAYEKSFFAMYEDPAHPLQPTIKDTISKMNPAFRNNPLTPLLAKALVSLQVISRQAAAQAKTPATAAVTPAAKSAAAQKKAGPTSSGQAADTGKKSKDEDVTMDDFNAVKES